MHNDTYLALVLYLQHMARVNMMMVMRTMMVMLKTAPMITVLEGVPECPPAGGRVVGGADESRLLVTISPMYMCSSSD